MYNKYVFSHTDNKRLLLKTNKSLHMVFFFQIRILYYAQVLYLNVSVMSVRDDLLARVDIVDVVGKYVQLRRTGKNRM